jgi:hypothetical protein
MLPLDTLLELIERVEKAMRPLSATTHSPDHDRVRELYLHLLTESADDPLEQARLTVLHDILQPYLTTLQKTTVRDTSAIAYNVKAAIGALVMLLCRLDDRDYDAAETSLRTARQLLEETQELLKSLLGNVAHA